MGPLPLGWEEVTTEDGRVYYWNVNTDATSWVRPASKVAPTPKVEPAPVRKRTANPAGPVLPKETDRLLPGTLLNEGGRKRCTILVLTDVR